MVPTRALMSASAIVLGLCGLAGTFAPDLLLAWIGAAPAPPLLLLVQLLGALYLGFAALNWMARDNLIGGVYSRPVAIGNLAHFVIGGLPMLKLLLRAGGGSGLWALAAAYLLLAVGFSVVLFRHPVRAA